MKVLALSLAGLALAGIVGLTSTGTSEAATVNHLDSDPAAPAVSSSIWSDWEQQVLTRHNRSRAKRGRSALTATDELGQAADQRCTELMLRFSHTRPSGQAWYTVLGEFGISYGSAGENIAWGQESPGAVHKAWMKSRGHKRNILNQGFDEAGVGHCTKNGRNYWVVLFKG